MAGEKTACSNHVHSPETAFWEITMLMTPAELEDLEKRALELEQKAKEAAA